jgi:hypothetical protein
MTRDDAVTVASAMAARVAALPARTTESDMRWHLMMQAAAFGENPLTDFVLANGRDYAIGPNTFDGPRGTPKECFANAAHLALRDRSLTYVEGKITCHGIPIDHAWCVDANGIVVDPTIDTPKGRISDYFGVPFRTDYLIKAMLANKVYGLLGWFCKTLEPLLELGLEAGQQELLDRKPAKRNRKKKAA